MSDITALTAELNTEKQLRAAAEMHCEVVTRQMEELKARLAEVEQERDNESRRARVYFVEARGYRLQLEQIERQRCEGYIWEPA